MIEHIYTLLIKAGYFSVYIMQGFTKAYIAPILIHRNVQNSDAFNMRYIIYDPNNTLDPIIAFSNKAGLTADYTTLRSYILQNGVGFTSLIENTFIYQPYIGWYVDPTDNTQNTFSPDHSQKCGEWERCLDTLIQYGKKEENPNKMMSDLIAWALKKEMKSVSLGTSKINYIDPRITVDFIKKHNISMAIVNKNKQKEHKKSKISKKYLILLSALIVAFTTYFYLKFEVVIDIKRPFKFLL